MQEGAEQILEQVKNDSVKEIQLQFTDILGAVKCVTIPASHMEDCLEYGTWFDGSSIQGFARIHESDMFLKPDLSTYVVLPWLGDESGKTARFICDVYRPDGMPFEGDPRNVLKRAVEDAKEMGFQYMVGPELEFFLFSKENGQIKVLPHDQAGYFDLTTDKAYEIRREMAEALHKFGIIVEASHHEVGIGQHEIDFRYDNALKAADNATTFRFVLKAVAQKNGLHATFMPKPMMGVNGSGMHVHQSLFSTETKTNAFYNESDSYNLSKTAYHFIAGLAHARAMSAVLSPTVNSYKRLVPGYEAPVYISWARVNRSALIRIPSTSKGKTSSTRIELRCPDPSCNIYLAFAAMLKAGLDGIKRNLAPSKPVEENLYHFDDSKLKELNIYTLPSSLWEAVEEMKRDVVIKETLGEHIYSKYIEAKTAEWNEFRLQVTQWEIERYLESY